MTMNRLRYIFPAMENFRENRPRLCWENMYGWIDGYGMFFDPAVHAAAGLIPEWETGWNGISAEDDFIVSPCGEASSGISGCRTPGIYVRPPQSGLVVERGRKSEKEKLVWAGRESYYPAGLPFDRYNEGAWQLGDSPAVCRAGSTLLVGFEAFAMAARFRDESPAQYLLDGADLVLELLVQAGLDRPAAEFLSARREDFQAYGVNRLLVQWLLELNGRSREAVKTADQAYLAAIAACRAGDEPRLREMLRQAFSGLAQLRQSVAPVDIRFLEYPHMGILFEESGFFELEWPEHTRRTLSAYIDQIEHDGYVTSVEAGSFSWKNLAARYPVLNAKIRELWKAGRIELTNGTSSLPYALMSPLVLQYLQLESGHRDFRQLFGMAPVTYQCQESSFSPQMPELLRYFGYRQVLHIVQNHGATPVEESEFLHWASPGGTALPALTLRHPALTHKGNNYFLDLPLVATEYSRTGVLNYVNFQDIGYVPLRRQMIKAHGYAPVWGRFAVADTVFAGFPDRVASKTYSADAYDFSATFFYGDATNANAFSHYERIYELTGLRRQLLFRAFASGQLPEFFSDINAVNESLCLLEAHDCSYVQDQRRGEFYHRFTNPPPYSRETLTEKVAALGSAARTRLMEVAAELAPAAPELYNAAEVPLGLAWVRPEWYSGAGGVRIDNRIYVAGKFGAFAAASPETAPERTLVLPFNNGNWQITISETERVILSRRGQTLSFAPVDRLAGAFELLQTRFHTWNGVCFLELNYQQNRSRFQALSLTVIFTADGDYCELLVKYSPCRDFDRVCRWNDYLAVDFEFNEALEKIYRFNPNVRSLTAENQIASPCYLAAVSANDRRISLLNAGAPLYEVDRANGRIRWLFHVADERECERRMALAFDTDDAFQLSRAWGQGLIPAGREQENIFAQIDWRNLSAENMLTEHQLMISNLSDAEIEFPFPETTLSVSLAEGRPGQGGKIKLKPFELALLSV